MGKTLDARATWAEFKAVDFGDPRLSRRLESIVGQVAEAPGSSFPEQMKSSAEREALYRFLGNENVSLEKLLEGHFEETRQRAVAAGKIRIVHDTSSFVYRGDRDGLGVVERGSNGFFGHFAQAVSADERRSVLGILGVLPHIHQQTKARRGKTKSQQTQYSRSLPREKRESSRWEKLATLVARQLPAGVDAIHVMDQEADDFALLSALVGQQLRFVVRGSGTRLTEAAGESIGKVLASKRGVVFRTVRLNRRATRQTATKRRPARTERDAKLHIRWAPVVLPRPQYAGTDVQQISANVVHVYEPDPPPNEERTEWYLFTTDPVETIEDASEIVDHYRARWSIEEFFKALKTGCAIEKRQLTSYDALLRTLGLFVPIAWKLLALRQLSKEPNPKPAAVLFDDEQIRVLRTVLSQRRRDHKLPPKPTIRDAMLAIAAIGGHIPNNGDPGWLVLGRGFQAYVEAEAIWHAAREL